MIALALLAATAAAPAAASPPRLIRAVPANGAVLNAGEHDLVWTFDRPMRRGSWSVTGLPATTPTFVGTPTFSADGRTFSVRMRLEPGRRYDIGVNSRDHRNFTDEAGVPAAVARVRFSTKR